MEGKLKEQTLHRLLEGIRRYGLENVSTLSKWIDIPVETARYMIWEELPKYCISVGITVNLPRIGLGRWMLQIRPVERSYTASIEEFLKQEAGLMYLGRVLPNNSCIATLGIPFGENYKLIHRLEHLKESDIIESYSLNEIEFLRNVSFNPSFYNFRSRSWNFEWEEVEKSKEPLLTPEPVEEQAPIIDYKDILILKELQISVPRTLSKLSKTIGLDQHNLRYHYKTHVRPAIAGYYLKLNPGELLWKQSTMVFIHDFENEKSFNEGRGVALTIPFTQRVWKTERHYCWHVSCPGEFSNGLLKYLNGKFSKIAGKLNVLIIDSETEISGIIPHALFNDRKGIWNYSPNSALTPVKK
jgi:DNA-binding Lrp family transcriptional regulator